MLLKHLATDGIPELMHLDAEVGGPAMLQIIRKLVREDRFEPPVEEYIAAAHQRVKEKQAKQRRLPFPLL